MYKIDINFVSENILCTRTQNIQSLNSKQINTQTHRLEYDIHNSGGFFFSNFDDSSLYYQHLPFQAPVINYIHLESWVKWG